MSRSVLIALSFSLLLTAGCLRGRKADDPLHPSTVRAAEPPSRGNSVKPASRVTTPDDLRLTPPVLETPAKLDDRKTLPERRDERKEKREERRNPEAPKLPSPKAPVTPSPTAPAPATPATGDLAQVRKIYDIAAAQFEKLVDFEARMVRREVIGKHEQPTEEVLFQYRKKPFSIYMKTIGEHGKGREVLYVDGQHDGKIHIVVGEGDGNVLMKPGSKLAFPPNSPIVLAKSRHKITEAGFEENLRKFGKLIALTENGTRPGGVKSLGKVERKEYSYPLDGIEIALQPGDDSTLPKGGKKFVFFDLKEDSAGYGCPVLVITQDDAGREVEYYCFDRFKNPAKLTEADFSPDRLQGKPGRR